MAVAAGVVGDPSVTAIPAALDMTAESSRAAVLNRRHNLELAKADVPGIGSAPGGSMALEDVCDHQPWAAHGRRTTPWFSTSLGSAVRAGRGGWLQCGSWYWRRGCRALWCRVWHGPEVSESREYRHSAQGGGWRNCAAACAATRASLSRRLRPRHGQHG